VERDIASMRSRQGNERRRKEMADGSGQQTDGGSGVDVWMCGWEQRRFSAAFSLIARYAE